MDQGWHSVVARGRLDDIHREDIATGTLDGLSRVDIPLIDIFHSPLREVEADTTIDTSLLHLLRNVVAGPVRRTGAVHLACRPSRVASHQRRQRR
jgi:hypothetical protein